MAETNQIERGEPYSSTPGMLRSLADRLAADGPSWDSEMCLAAAKEMELYMGMIVGGPVEVPETWP